MARDAPIYVPEVADLWYRANAQQWFSQQKWDDRIVDDIMYREHPTIDTVEKLVNRLGADAAYDLIRRINL